MDSIKLTTAPAVSPVTAVSSGAEAANSDPSGLAPPVGEGFQTVLAQQLKDMKLGPVPMIDPTLQLPMLELTATELAPTVDLKTAVTLRAQGEIALGTTEVVDMLPLSELQMLFGAKPTAVKTARTDELTADLPASEATAAPIGIDPALTALVAPIALAALPRLAPAAPTTTVPLAAAAPPVAAQASSTLEMIAPPVATSATPSAPLMVTTERAPGEGRTPISIEPSAEKTPLAEIFNHPLERNSESLGHTFETKGLTPFQATFAHQLSAAPASAPTAVPAAMQVATPLGGPGWADEMGQKMIVMIGAKEQSAEIHVNPPNLGPMEIKLTVEGNKLTAVFISAHSEVRLSLDAALPRLREVLAESGINLGQASVTADTPRDSNAYSQAQQHFRGEREPAVDAPLESVAPRVAVRARSMVDLFA